MGSPLAPEAQERVLSTLNRDGSRRWLRPRLSRGRFLLWRRIVAYGLIAREEGGGDGPESSEAIAFEMVPLYRLRRWGIRAVLVEKKVA